MKIKLNSVYFSLFAVFLITIVVTAGFFFLNSDSSDSLTGYQTVDKEVVVASNKGGFGAQKQVWGEYKSGGSGDFTIDLSKYKNTYELFKITGKSCYNHQTTGDYYTFYITALLDNKLAHMTYYPSSPNTFGGKGSKCEDISLEIPSDKSIPPDYKIRGYPSVDKVTIKTMTQKGYPYSDNTQFFAYLRPITKRTTPTPVPTPSPTPSPTPVPTPTPTPTSTPQPTIKLLSPKAGEQLKAGETYRIKWESSSNVKEVDLNFGFPDGASYSYTKLDWKLPNTGYYDWKVFNVEGNKYKIMVTGKLEGIYAENDYSDYFSIFKSASAPLPVIPPPTTSVVLPPKQTPSPTPVPVVTTPKPATPTPTPAPTSTPKPTPSVRIISPNGGETLKLGENYKITWESQNSDKVWLGYTTGPGSLDWIATDISNQNFYDWKVNTPITALNKFKVSITAYQTGVGSTKDESDNFFSVVQQPIFAVVQPTPIPTPYPSPTPTPTPAPTPTPKPLPKIKDVILKEARQIGNAVTPKYTSIVCPVFDSSTTFMELGQSIEGQKLMMAVKTSFVFTDLNSGTVSKYPLSASVIFDGPYANCFKFEGNVPAATVSGPYGRSQVLPLPESGWKFEIVADPDNLISETDENNNAMQCYGEICPAKPPVKTPTPSPTPKLAPSPAPDLGMTGTVTLKSIILEGNNIIIDYTKDFSTCAHLLTSDMKMVHTKNFFCENKGPISVSLSDFNTDLKPGTQLKLCHGNNYGLCSQATYFGPKPTTISSPTITPTISPTPAPTKTTTPLPTITSTAIPQKSLVECTDSDGGKDYYTQGIVNRTVGGSPSTYKDICNNLFGDKPINGVKERYCSGTDLKTEIFDCPYGCEEGACRKTPVATPTPAPEIKPVRVEFPIFVERLASINSLTGRFVQWLTGWQIAQMPKVKEYKMSVSFDNKELKYVGISQASEVKVSVKPDTTQIEITYSLPDSFSSGEIARLQFDKLSSGEADVTIDSVTSNGIPVKVNKRIGIAK